MAAQVLNGTGNISYTNSTGQNVRVVINYIFSPSSQEFTFALGGWSMKSNDHEQSMGKTLAYMDGSSSGGWRNQMYMTSGNLASNDGWPMEFALANGDTFSYTSDTRVSEFRYNIIIIPEAG